MQGRRRQSFDWVSIPAGPVQIGAQDAPADAVPSSELPATTPRLPAFSIGRVPVTNAQYGAFVAAAGHPAPAHWEGSLPPASLAQHPVTYVDWADATAFCAWAGVRLPTEAEWEKTARGSDGRPFPWGPDRPSPRQANCEGWYGSTTEVGTFPAGASPYGALDMAGDVWEWTASLARPYPYRHDDGREDPAAPGRRIVRGGSFRHVALDVRCAARTPLHPDARDEYIGFRVAVDDAAAGERIAFDWVHVPEGPFHMGTAVGSGVEATAHAGGPRATTLPPGLGEPVHQVDVVAFSIARTPITNRQYAAYVSAAGAPPPGHWGGRLPPRALLEHPVTSVDWHDARAYCLWAAVRLPTEVEWETAAAGADGRPFPWGAEPPDESRAWFAHGDDPVGTRPVGERPAGASLYGVLEMAGDVWEWTSSLHWPYPWRVDDGREDPATTGQRVLRGGSFRSPGAEYLRCAFRSRSYPTRRRDHIGFRVVRSSPA